MESVHRLGKNRLNPRGTPKSCVRAAQSHSGQIQRLPPNERGE
jgi:hypothetical protein